MRTRRRGMHWIPGIVVLLAILVVNFASFLGIARLPVLAGLVGPRNAVLAGLIGLGVVLVALAVLARRARRILIPLALALLIGAATSVPVVAARGVHNDPVAPLAAGQLRILSWNINGDLVSATTVARRAAKEQANIVVLPEIRARAHGQDYARAFAAAGLQMTAYPAITTEPTEAVVFVADSLGSYTAAVAHDAEPERSALLTPRTSGLPTLVAIHASQPSLRSNPAWNAHLTWVAHACSDPNTIAVGDYNATLDSLGAGPLGRCTDAAATRGAASVGTWPTRVPTWLAMPLDHVYVGADWRVKTFTVLTSEDASGSRHRPILAVITRTGRR